MELTSVTSAALTQARVLAADAALTSRSNKRDAEALSNLNTLAFVAATLKKPEIIYRSPSNVTRWATRVTIEGNVFTVLYDTGCNVSIALKKECLDKIRDKTLFSQQQVGNCLGNAGLRNTYIVPTVEIKGAVLKTVLIGEYEHNLTDRVASGKRDGLMGLPVFALLGSFFLDLSNGQVFNHAWGDVEPITKLGYVFDEFIRVPFEKNAGSDTLILSVETEFGTLRFLFDTGAGVSTIQPSVVNVQEYKKIDITEKKASYCTLSLFKIGGKNFENTSLALRQAAIPYDGILGMDFLQNCVIDFNVAERVLFIGDSLKKNKKSKGE